MRPMYKNLMEAIKDRNLGMRAVSGAIGCTPRSLYNKLMGRTDFTVKEAMKLQREMLMEYSLEYLFADDSEDGQGAGEA